MTTGTGDGFAAKIASLYLTGEYSDFTITCGPNTHKVHKAIVCSRSEFFKKAESFPAGKEAAENAIDLPEDEPEIIDLLIQYLYEGQYTCKAIKADIPDQTPNIPTGSATKSYPFHYKFPHSCVPMRQPEESYVCPHHICYRFFAKGCIDFVCKSCCPDWETCSDVPGSKAAQLLVHTKMYEIGDKYDVVGLKDYACKQFTDACAKHWNSEHFATAADYAFSSTPDSDGGSRDVVAEVIAEHIELLNKPAIETVVNHFGSLGFRLLKKKASATGWAKPAAS